MENAITSNVETKANDILSETDIINELLKNERTKELEFGVDYFLFRNENGEIIPKLSNKYLTNLIIAVRTIIDNDDIIDCAYNLQVDSNDIDTLLSPASGLKGIVDSMENEVYRIRGTLDTIGFCISVLREDKLVNEDKQNKYWSNIKHG